MRREDPAADGADPNGNRVMNPGLAGVGSTWPDWVVGYRAAAGLWLGLFYSWRLFILGAAMCTIELRYHVDIPDDS